MNDLDLKKLLLETCPILPGQEELAWLNLKERLASPGKPALNWLFVPTWRSFAFTALGLFLAATIFNLGFFLHPTRHGMALADSQTPGVYATSFYSNSAQAQVIWLNGMQPASDKPTYLDPSTVIAPKSHSADDPDTL